MTVAYPGMPEESFPPARAREFSGASTALLFAQTRAGDLYARDVLVARLRARLLRWAAGRIPARLRSTMDTQDLVQGAFARSLRRLPTLEPAQDNAPLVYLRTAILNHLRNAIRDEDRHPHERTVDVAVADPAATPLENLLGVERLQRLEGAMGRLDEEDRQLLFLRFELGCCYAAVAEHLGKPSVDAARMAVKRAVRRLLLELQRDS